MRKTETKTIPTYEEAIEILRETIRVCEEVSGDSTEKTVAATERLWWHFERDGCTKHQAIAACIMFTVVYMGTNASPDEKGLIIER